MTTTAIEQPTQAPPAEQGGPAAEEILRIEQFLDSAAVRMAEQRPAGNGELARMWRVSIEHLDKTLTYWRRRVMVEPGIAQKITHYKADQSAEAGQGDG